jgi:predicted phosphodiesterase
MGKINVITYKYVIKVLIALGQTKVYLRDITLCDTKILQRHILHLNVQVLFIGHTHTQMISKIKMKFLVFVLL